MFLIFSGYLPGRASFIYFSELYFKIVVLEVQKLNIQNFGTMYQDGPP